MKSLRCLIALLFCAATSHAAPLSGRLAYVQNGAAYVVTLPDGKAARLPESGTTFLVSMAPTGGTVLYFNRLKAGCRVFLSRPPYKTARRLDKPFDSFRPNSVQWTRDGAAVLLASWEESYLFRPATGVFLRVPAGEAMLSRDGRQIAFAAEKEIKLRQSGGKERVLFSIHRPQPLLDANIFVIHAGLEHQHIALRRAPDRLRDRRRPGAHDRLCRRGEHGERGEDRETDDAAR